MLRFSALFLITVTSVTHAESHTVSIDWQMLHSNGKISTGSGVGFLFSRQKRIVVTAYHVLPTITPSLKDGILTVNGVTAKLKCFWEDADVAFLELEQDLHESVPELNLELSPKIGTVYEAKRNYSFSFNNTNPFFSDAEQELLLEGVFTSSATVISIAETLKKTPEGFIPVPAQYLISDSAQGPGFSGGPAINVDGKVIGIVKGSFEVKYGILSSATNIERMTLESKCK